MNKNKRNTTWTIRAASPLLRPGLTIEITVSEDYVQEETMKLMDRVREINKKVRNPYLCQEHLKPIAASAMWYECGCRV